ncbi:unnamed protein product [Penicillium roqueforti FM164]|uniref:Genomic scaffold, ProqFM164S02 n=1 Tax=Penicillium roqueforti (strain FM164) TaxID=1365484 RepID=W6Q1L7_PENRF|nr:unnamed protein product [Penicillium roqueforti FM164]
MAPEAPHRALLRGLPRSYFLDFRFQFDALVLRLAWMRFEVFWSSAFAMTVPRLSVLG